LTGSR